MDEQLMDWIIRFQRDKDIEAPAHLKDYCYEMIEPLIEEFTMKYGEEAGELLRLKWDKRFYFIFTKYQVNVGLPLETFVKIRIVFISCRCYKKLVISDRKTLDLRKTNQGLSIIYRVDLLLNE